MELSSRIVFAVVFVVVIVVGGYLGIKWVNANAPERKKK